MELVTDCGRAIATYQQAIQLDPNNVDARKGLDDAHNALGSI